MPSVLLIEDEPGQRRLVERMLGRAYPVTWCTDRQTALSQMTAGGHDIWLIDHYLGNGDGLDLLTTARQSVPHTAAILLTSAADPLVDRRALALGAALRLEKSELTAERLRRAVDFAIEQARRLTELAEWRAARDTAAGDGARLARFARAEATIRAALDHDVVGLDRGLFFGRLLQAGLALTGARSGLFATLEHGCVVPEALVGVRSPAGPPIDERPFEPPAGSLLAATLSAGEPVRSEAATPSGLPGWAPAHTIALPLGVGGTHTAVVLLGDAPADAAPPADLLDTYAALCAGALERHAVDRRRYAAELSLQRCERLLQAVTGLSRRLSAMTAAGDGADSRGRAGETDALVLAARCLGVSSEARRASIVERGPRDWQVRTEWSAAGEPSSTPRERIRLSERVALELQARRGDDAPVLVPTMPGRPSLVVTPIRAPAAGPAPAADAPPGLDLWGALVLVGSPIDVDGVARGILRSAGQAIGGHLGCLSARRGQAERMTHHTASAAPVDAHITESLDRLAGGVAHELNNLLTVIVTSAAIAVDALPADAPVAPDLEAIADASRAGARLASRLLQCAAAQPVTLRPVDVRAVLDGSAPLLESIARPRARVVIEPPDVPLRMLADVAQVKRILLELVRNGAEAEPENGCTVRAAAATGPSVRDGRPVPGENRAYVVISVADDGRGMAPETQRRMFEPFFTTKIGVRGAGMGLATVFGIVRRHNGRLTVETAPERGTVVHVWLPRSLA